MAYKKKLIVVPLAGLGNRMRVLSSCVQIAKNENRTLWIAWPVNADLGCDITDIFQSVGLDYSIPPKWLYYLLTKIYRLAVIKKFYRAYKICSRIFFDDTIFDRDISTSDNQLNRNINDRSLLVATCLAFGNPSPEFSFTEYLKNETNRDFFKLFIFNDYIKNEVDMEYEKIGVSYIGIHIRRTDHYDIIKQSPDHNYFSEIDKSIYANPEQKFFLASDDDETKKRFTQKYGERIYTPNRKLGRSDKEGIYAGIIEMLLLARSTKIICSIISSYSGTAILIGDIKEVIYVDEFIK